MPNATIDTTATRRADLKTLDGAYVVLRSLTYGEYLARRDKAMAATTDGVSRDVAIKAMQAEVTRFEFSTMIVDHNLEDATGRKLNFGNPHDFNMVNPKVGEEIAGLIDEYLDWEKSEESTFQTDKASDLLPKATARKKNS